MATHSSYSAWLLAAAVVFLVGLFVFFLPELAPRLFPISIPTIRPEGVVSSIPVTNPFQRIVEEIGVALMIAAAAAVCVERLTHARLLAAIHDALATLRTGSDVLAGATSLAVCDIVTRNGPDSERYARRLKAALEQELQKKDGRIRIACVAAPELLRLDRPLARRLDDEITRPGCTTSIEFLLLCPTSPVAVTRYPLEPDHPALQDINNALGRLRVLSTKALARVSFQCYDLCPQVFVVMTSEFVFVEPYPTYQSKQGPLGGEIPLLVMSKESNAFSIWQKHFDFVRQHHSCTHSEHRL